MKTTKEEALELVEKMRFNFKGIWSDEIDTKISKQCALITIDFVIEKIRKKGEYSAKSEINWYNRMKEEIEKL